MDFAVSVVSCLGIKHLNPASRVSTVALLPNVVSTDRVFPIRAQDHHAGYPDATVDLLSFPIFRSGSLVAPGPATQLLRVGGSTLALREN